MSKKLKRTKNRIKLEKFLAEREKQNGTNAQPSNTQPRVNR